MKPFNGGRPEIAAAPIRKSQAGTWHSPQQTTEVVDLASMSAVQNVTSRQKKQSFEERVVQDMQQGPGKTDDRDGGRARAQSECSHPEAQRDDADVLDTVISEQALEVMLRQREQDADHSGSKTDPAQHPSPPAWGAPRNIMTRSKP